MKATFGIAVSLIFFLSSITAQGASIEQVRLIWNRLVGVPPTQTQISAAMTKLSRGASLLDIANDATNEAGFYNSTVNHLFAPMCNRQESFLTPRPVTLGATNIAGLSGAGSLNDCVATAIGITRDDRSAQELLTGNYIYRADPAKYGTVNIAGTSVNIQQDTAIYQSNVHYAALEVLGANLKDALVRAPQRVYTSSATAVPANYPANTTLTPALAIADAPPPAAAGLLTTYTWGMNHYIAGTNRRPFQYAAQEFLCRSIKSIADSTFVGSPAKVAAIRPDVERAHKDFNPLCISCHGALDKASNAFAHIDFVGNGTSLTEGRVIYLPNLVIPKINKNIIKAGEGTPVASAQWENGFTENQNRDIGWPATRSGNDIHELGVMFANTEAFASCMARRVFVEVCKRNPGENSSSGAREIAALDELSRNFVNNGYKLRSLFNETAARPECIGN